MVQVHCWPTTELLLTLFDLPTVKSAHRTVTDAVCGPLSRTTDGSAMPHAALLVLAVNVLVTVPFTGIATTKGALMLPFGPASKVKFRPTNTEGALPPLVLLPSVFLITSAV